MVWLRTKVELLYSFQNGYTVVDWISTAVSSGALNSADLDWLFWWRGCLLLMGCCWIEKLRFEQFKAQMEVYIKSVGHKNRNRLRSPCRPPRLVLLASPPLEARKSFMIIFYIFMLVININVHTCTFPAWSTRQGSSWQDDFLTTGVRIRICPRKNWWYTRCLVFSGNIRRLVYMYKCTDPFSAQGWTLNISWGNTTVQQI
jgi:hypothetical protein